MSEIKQIDLVRIKGRKEAGDDLYVVRNVETNFLTGVQRISAHPFAPRLYTGRDTAPTVHESLLPEEIQRLPTPAEALAGTLPLRQEAWPTRTKHSIERLFALWLLHEDRKHLLDAAKVDQLAHQVSLLEYVKQKDLRRLLIADEVGLGKTIEAGMLIQWVLEASPSARILYLAPAMLVDNVYGEIKRMEVPARIDRYSASVSTITNEALKEAQVIVASIHRAAYERNLKSWQEDSGAWDLIIVDECHHASDWSEDGTDPMSQMRLVRALVDNRLKPGGRLVLMSATPHQGNTNKFRNLLRLLSDDGYRDATGSLASVAGRVVYRTKEDVRDWNNQPLFSKRLVNEPTFVQLGKDYHDWMESIEAVFQATDAGPATWRKAQALQWAASSPKAGLAYLTRLALRSGLDFDNDPVLQKAAAALRPYRGLPAEAPVEAVRSLLEKQAGKSRAEDDEHEDLGGDAPVDTPRLIHALERGLQLIRSDAMRTKLAPLFQWVTDEAPAKFVVFASPIETVDEVRLGLQHLLGVGAVVTITGGMKPYERLAQMQAFRGERVRVLVASKAGSEGINLQVSHRLVHFDVPWNPMEMEQRVGRVHRYGSTHTVIVDTLVAKGSREAKMLSRCRARLAQIVGNLFGQDNARFDEMYARVMTQVSGEDLAALMAEEGFLTNNDDESLDKLVQAGFEGWQASDKALRQGAASTVREIPDRGEARETDMEKLFELLGAEQEGGWHHVRLVESNGERLEETAPARVWVFPSEGANIRRVADRVSSLSVRGPNGFQGFVERAGLNLPGIAAKVRELVGGANPEVGRSPRAVGFFDGAGAARVPEPDWADWARAAALDVSEWRDGAVLLAWTVRLFHRGTRTQTWSGVQTWLAKPDLTYGCWLTSGSSAELYRLLWNNRRRQTLQIPPHRRADKSRFSLDDLCEQATPLVRMALEELKSVAIFEPETHDVEIVPIAAMTIEPRKDIVTREVEEEDPADEAFEILDTAHRPSPDFLERVLGAVANVPSARSLGDRAVYVLLVVEPARLAESDSHEHTTAFGVYVGTTDQDLVIRYQEHRDPNALRSASSLNWNGLELVGVVWLDGRFRGLSQDTAAALEQNLADTLHRLGLRVLGGH